MLSKRKLSFISKVSLFSTLHQLHSSCTYEQTSSCWKGSEDPFQTVQSFIRINSSSHISPSYQSKFGTKNYKGKSLNLCLSRASSKASKQAFASFYYYFKKNYLQHDVNPSKPLFSVSLILSTYQKHQRKTTELLKFSRKFALFLIKLPPQVMLKICLSKQLTCSPVHVVLFILWWWYCSIIIY